MNENLNLAEILKDCPEGTKLYSPVLGEVDFVRISNDDISFPIRVRVRYGMYTFSSQGRFCNIEQGECLLFPSKDQRDWSKFNPKKPKQPKFNPNTLNPFDKVLARNDGEDWSCVFFSHIVKDEETYPYACGYDWFTYCIPYNDDTKCLVGTTEEAPEYYRYWED